MKNVHFPNRGKLSNNVSGRCFPGHSPVDGTAGREGHGGRRAGRERRQTVGGGGQGRRRGRGALGPSPCSSSSRPSCGCWTSTGSTPCSPSSPSCCWRCPSIPVAQAHQLKRCPPTNPTDGLRLHSRVCQVAYPATRPGTTLALSLAALAHSCLFPPLTSPAPRVQDCFRLVFHRPESGVGPARMGQCEGPTTGFSHHPSPLSPGFPVAEQSFQKSPALLKIVQCDLPPPPPSHAVPLWGGGG